MRTGFTEFQRKTIGDRLMKARLAAGHANRKEACRTFGFNVNTFKAHEYGHRGVSRAEAEQYAAAFDVSADDLLNLRNMVRPAKPTVPSDVPIGEMVRTTSPEDARTFRTTSHHIVPHGTVVDTNSVEDVALVRTKRTKRTTRTTDGAQAAPDSIPVKGASAYGIWVSAGGVPLQRDAAVPPVPNLPVGCQYARQAVGDSRSGLYRDGDYLIFLKHDGRPLQTGHHDIRRHKGALGENSVWMAKGRILKSDGGGADDPEEFHFDPDDTSVTVEGIVIAVFRPIVSDR